MFKLRIKAFPFHKISSIIYDNNIKFSNELKVNIFHCMTNQKQLLYWNKNKISTIIHHL